MSGPMVFYAGKLRKFINAHMPKMKSYDIDQAICAANKIGCEHNSAAYGEQLFIRIYDQRKVLFRMRIHDFVLAPYCVFEIDEAQQTLTYVVRDNSSTRLQRGSEADFIRAKRELLAAMGCEDVTISLPYPVHEMQNPEWIGGTTWAYQREVTALLKKYVKTEVSKAK